MPPAHSRRQPTADSIIELTPALLNIGHILVPSDFSAPSRKALK